MTPFTQRVFRVLLSPSGKWYGYTKASLEINKPQKETILRRHQCGGSNWCTVGS